MRRRYKKELYSDRVNYIRHLMPYASIGADVIVGFPGETEKDFNDTLEFLQSLNISYLHVFTYSERSDTAAVDMPGIIPVNIRQQRNKILRNLSYQKSQFFNHQHLGQIRPVLFEGHSKKGMMEGYTDNYIKVTIPYKAEWVNQIIDWKI